MSELCDTCGERPGDARGDGLEDLGLCCDECFGDHLEDGRVLPYHDGGFGMYDLLQIHPFRVNRYTDDPLGALFSATPEDRTSAGTVRVLARGQGAGKLGLKGLLDAMYVSWTPPLEAPDEWEQYALFDLPGLWEGVGKTNDTVLREILGAVNENLGLGRWVVLVAVPRQLAYVVYVMYREAE